MSLSRSSLPYEQAYAAPSHRGGYAPASPEHEQEQTRRPAMRVRSSYTKKAAALPEVIYWLALAAMMFCIFQCVRTIVVESYAMLARIKNQPIIEQYYEQTVQENRVLHERIQSASTRQGMEAMARNYLNLIGEGEILVRLH